MTAPFERLRTMMMADYSNRTLLGTAKKMWRSGGFYGLWRGNLVSVVKVVPQSAIQYAVSFSRSCYPVFLPCQQLLDPCAAPLTSGGTLIDSGGADPLLAAFWPCPPAARCCAAFAMESISVTILVPFCLYTLKNHSGSSAAVAIASCCKGFWS